MSSDAERAATLEILPSIDLRGGKVVDLFQGDYAQETTYEQTGEDVAEQFIAGGTRWIHIVDLDGSKGGAPENGAIVRRIAQLARAADVRVELGGGIRSVEAAQRALDLGVSRVIFGTVAVEQPGVVSQAVGALGAEAVIVGIDARNGMVATRGWTQGSGLRAVDLARHMEDAGVVRFIYTDITRDSTLTEPNFDEVDALNRAVRGSVIASGGVTTVEQVRRLAGLDLEGAIIGSALYAGRITLRDALEAGSGSNARLR